MAGQFRLVRRLVVFWVLTTTGLTKGQTSLLPPASDFPPPPEGTRTVEEDAPFEFLRTKAALKLSDADYAVICLKFMKIRESAVIENSVEPLPSLFPRDAQGKRMFEGFTSHIPPGERSLSIALIDLQRAVDDQAGPDVVVGKLRAVETARGKARADLQLAVDDAFKLLNKRQEAIVIATALQGYLYPLRFGIKSFTVDRTTGLISPGIYDQLGLKDEPSKAIVAEKLRKMGTDIAGLRVPPTVVHYRLPGEPLIPIAPNSGPPQPSDPTIKSLVDAYTDLVKTLQNEESPINDVSAKLDAFQKARADVDADLAATEKELMSILTLRQQAILVTNGMLEWTELSK